MSATILVIEDNPTNLELMVYLLEAYGYSVESARDGKNGLELAFHRRPDLIVCDLEMPGMTGFEVARELRAGESTCAGVPLLAVTAYAMVGDRDKVLAAGFDGYLSKPIQAETFVKQLEAFLAPEKRSSTVPQSHDVSTVSQPSVQPRRAAVLVVDDSWVNLSLISGTLEPSGYSVTAATSVDAATDHVQRTSFDLILSDLHMPQNSGMELLRRLKADPVLKLVPFILITASTVGPGKGERERALALGADKFLMRPIEPERLLLEIEDCLAIGRNKQSKT